MGVIDAWIQHPTRRFLQEPFLDSLKRWLGQDIDEIPLAFTVDAMESAGVDTAMLSAWYGPQGPLISNEEVLEVVRAHPDRFAGLASADLRDPVAAVRSLRTLVNEHGFKGLRIIQWLWELRPDHRLYYPLYAACVELEVPVCLQVGLTGPLRSSETGRPLHIERVALDFPELTIVCGHIGYPWHQEMIALATKFENVHIDTSAYKPKRYPPELVQFMKTNGRHKVLFGSNYPMIQPKQCLDELDRLELDDECRQLFVEDNARRVFGL
jgi:hypothetical protein